MIITSIWCFIVMIQLFIAKILDEDELRLMVGELEINISCYDKNGSSAEASSGTSHPNLIHLLGLYEDSRDTLFVVFDGLVKVEIFARYSDEDIAR